MKRVLLVMTCVLLVASCKKESHIATPVVQSEKLTGEWVYDNPDEGVWEKMKFTESGVFYYSNDVATWSIENDRNDGRYSIFGDNGEKLRGQYTLNGQPLEVNMTFSALNDYSFTATFAETGLTFTYARLLTTQRISKQGDKVTPNYTALVTADISFYKSHDTSIATVDYSTGEITAVAVSGRTYIDVVTSKGTAVVEVLVSDKEKMFDDYSWAFGLTIDEVVSRVGNKYLYKDEATGVSYKSKNLLLDYERYMTSTIDDSHVEFVQLVLNSAITDEEVTGFLKSKYRFLATSEEGTDSYVEQSTGMFIFFGLSDNKKERVLSFAKTILWPDFNCFFGLNGEQVRKRMEQNNHLFFDHYVTYSVHGSDGYGLTTNNTKAFGVEFVYNADSIVSTYLLYPSQGVRQSEILQHFMALGLTGTTENGNTVYYNANKTLSMSYRAVTGPTKLIVVTDMTKKAFDRNNLGEYWLGLGMTVGELKNAFGEPYQTYDERLLYIVSGNILDEYVSSVNYFFNNGSDKVNLINLYLKDGITELEVKTLLSKLYKLFDSGVNDNGQYYRYINGITRDESTIITTYYPEYAVIVYQHPSTASAHEALVLIEQ